MKRKVILRVVFFLFVSVAFFGCATAAPPPLMQSVAFVSGDAEVENWVPLTATLLRQILNNNDNDWGKTLREMQLRIADEVTLERPVADSETRPQEGTVYRNINEQQIRIIVDRLQDGMGLAGLNEGRGWDERFFLSVGFDRKNQNARLQFSNMGDHRDELIYLDYIPFESKIGAEKGFTLYGTDEKLYTVKYSGDKTPFLLINLKEIPNITVDASRVPGLRWEDLQQRR